MKLSDVKAKIDAYFDNITPEEFLNTLIKYHMRTQFKGTINGKEFTNVQDYNTEMQRLIAAGEPINAHADTQTIQEPQNDNSFLFPGFAQCESVNKLSEEFIDVALGLDPDEFACQVNDLLHNRILPAIEKMTPTQIGKYKDIVAGILSFLGKLAVESDAKAEVVVKRLEEIEQELADLKLASEHESDRKAVIDFVTSLYESIDKAVNTRIVPMAEVITPQRADQGDPAGPQGQPGCPCECTRGIANPGCDYIEGIKEKARKLFGL